MTIDADKGPLKKQATLKRFFQRYQAPSDVDAVALLRSRALQEAHRRNSSPKSQSPQEPSSSETRPSNGHIDHDDVVASTMTYPRAKSTSPPLANQPLVQENTHASTPPDRASPSPAGPVGLQMSQQQDLKRKQSTANSHHDAAALVSADERTPRAAKRSRSTSAEPIPYQFTPTSSTSLSAPPPTSQLSVPSSLKSLSFGLSQGRPAYVPSSQSDEDSASDNDVSVPAQAEQEHGDIGQDPLDTDSDSSLSSLDDIMNSILRPPKDSAIRETRLRSSYGRPGKYSLTATSQKPLHNGKYSLSNLIDQHNRDASAQAEISRAQSVLDDLVDDPDDIELAESGGVDKSLLASVVKKEDGEDEVDKLLHAMNRADMLNTEIAWHFFDSNSQKPSQPKPLQFPKLHGDFAKYQDLFKSHAIRTSTFLTGFAHEIISPLSLPNELRDWLWHAALLEPADDLAEAYMTALKSPKSMNLLGTDDILIIFECLNAKASAMNISNEIKPIQKNINAPRRRHPPRLPRVLRMLTCLSGCLSTAAKSNALAILLRLAVDSEIVNDIEVRLGLHGSIVALVSNLPEDMVDETLFSIASNLLTLTHPILQNGLLTSVPSTTPRLHLFKRRLAIAFFLSSPKFLDGSFFDAPTSTQLPRAITTRLKTDPHFHISDSTIDYRSLAASISILDIAIDNGFPSASLSTKEQDATIDALIGHVHVLFARIVDSGASHLARTEAKAVLERLLYRLDFAVRSKPRESRGALVGASTRTMLDYVIPPQRKVTPDDVENPAAKDDQDADDNDDDDDDDEAYVTADEDAEAIGQSGSRVLQFMAKRRTAVTPVMNTATKTTM